MVSLYRDTATKLLYQLFSKGYVMEGGLPNNSRSTTLYTLWSYCNSVWSHHFKVSGPSTCALTLASWLLFKAYSIGAQYCRLLKLMSHIVFTETILQERTHMSMLFSYWISTLCSYVQNIIAMKTHRICDVHSSVRRVDYKILSYV